MWPQVSVSLSMENGNSRMLHCAVLCLVAQSCPTLWDPMDYSLPGSSIHEDSPGQNTGAGCHAFLQGIFPTQGSNTGLSHCRWILYYQSHLGSPGKRWSSTNWRVTSWRFLRNKQHCWRGRSILGPRWTEGDRGAPTPTESSLLLLFSLYGKYPAYLCLQRPPLC